MHRVSPIEADVAGTWPTPWQAGVAHVEGSDRRRTFVAGAYSWNHPIIIGLFGTAANPPEFCASLDQAISEARHRHGRVVAWASRVTKEHVDACRACGVELVFVEDGFVRSIGLGAGFAMACSLAVDTQGMHYDACRPSDLEMMLREKDLTADEMERGRAIRQNLIRSGLSKYNLGWRERSLNLPYDREIVLVPGQVSDDRSIVSLLSGTIDRDAEMGINEQLLRAARERWPDAYIVYKPHPDVLADLRRGRVPRRVARQYADAVVGDCDISNLLDSCDIVETISSLTGFEALIRGKRVCVHGIPFYAGWGLTEDLTPAPCRGRRRSIDELVFIALVLYTRHIHPVTRKPCEIETLIDALALKKSDRKTRLRNSGMKRVAWLYSKLGL